MAQSTPTDYSGRPPTTSRKRPPDQFEKMADKATDQFKNVADQAEDVANRVAEQGREAGERVQEVAGNFKGAVDQLGEGPADGDAGRWPRSVGFVLGALWKS